jgi:hypothetical protein
MSPLPRENSDWHQHRHQDSSFAAPTRKQMRHVLARQIRNSVPFSRAQCVNFGFNAAKLASVWIVMRGLKLPQPQVEKTCLFFTN